MAIITILFLLLLFLLLLIKKWPVVVRMWRNWNPQTLLVVMQTVAATTENSLSVPQKVNLEWPFDPGIPLSGPYPKGLKTGLQTKTWTRVFVAALSQITKGRKQPKGLLIGSQMKKNAVSSYRKTLPGHQKEGLTHAAAQMNWEHYAARKRPYIACFHLYKVSRVGKPIET